MHATDRHTTDDTFLIVFANAPIKLEQNQLSRYSVQAATQTTEQLWFHFWQFAHDFSSPNIKLSLESTQPALTGQ